MRVLRCPGDFMAEFGVSHTVVREAISRLQAAGVLETRHGVGTFVLGQGEGATFRIDAATLQDVIGVLELRFGMETEGAALAAMRRTPEHLASLRAALGGVGRGIARGPRADGTATIEQVGWELFRLMLDVASGRRKTWAGHWRLHNALVLFNPAPVT